MNTTVGKIVTQLGTATHFTCGLCGETIECGHAIPDIRRMLLAHYTLHSVDVTKMAYNHMSGEITLNFDNKPIEHCCSSDQQCINRK